jgi:hypothetical protein
MSEVEAKPVDNIQLCSAVMRAPYVFEQYGPLVGGPSGIEALARDLVIYLAWNRVEQVRLNVREFAKLFGYSHAYLFKKLTDDQKAWLKLKEFNPATHKNLITYTLAKLFIEQANFPKDAPLSLPTQEGQRIEVYDGLQFISKIWVGSDRAGTTYKFFMHPGFLQNCKEWYQEFDLNEYLELKSTSGRAWSAGRRMYLHLAWKRGVWNEAISKGRGRGHEKAQLDELLRVAGFKYKDEARQIHELRQLLDDLALFAAIKMHAEIKLNNVGSYEIEFTRMKEVEQVKA